MKILIDIGHPGHVHLFKHFAFVMQQKGHSILFTTRQKEYEEDLLKSFNFNYVSFGKHYNSKIKKIVGVFKFDYQLLKTARRFKPDLFLSHGSFYASHVAKFLRKPHISMEDSGNWEQMKLYLPFTEAVLTPNELPQEIGLKQIRYNGFHEIAYLHPNYYKANNNVLSYLGVKPGEKYIILRFVSWNATHDVGHKGLNYETKLKLVHEFEKDYKIFISSEGSLPPELKKYQITIPPQELHDALYYSSMVISEGATIASEAGLLGVPTLYVNSIERCYNVEQGKYGTVYNFSNSDGVLEKVREILENYIGRKEYLEKSNKIFADKIDVTAFLVWFIEEFPNSLQKMKTNPEYQNRFK